MGKIVGAGGEILDKLEPEPHKSGPATATVVLYSCLIIMSQYMVKMFADGEAV
jgi:hypothetical protein